MTETDRSKVFPNCNFESNALWAMFHEKIIAKL